MKYLRVWVWFTFYFGLINHYLREAASDLTKKEELQSLYCLYEESNASTLGIK